jgi:hypothetical protein
VTDPIARVILGVLTLLAVLVGWEFFDLKDKFEEHERWHRDTPAPVETARTSSCEEALRAVRLQANTKAAKNFTEYCKPLGEFVHYTGSCVNSKGEVILHFSPIFENID